MLRWNGELFNVSRGLSVLCCCHCTADAPDISQDLLESVVEGPEADEIYEMYFNGIETTSSLKTAQGNEVDDTDEDGYAAMRDVITIE